MKKTFIIILVLLAVAQIGSASAVAATPPGFPPGVDVTVLTPLPTELDVGETYTIQIQVESERPFDQAAAMKDAYYPGRGVFLTTGRRAHNSTSAILTAKVTGKNSTADLESVCGWPLPDSECTSAGAAPLAVAVGVRYSGGELYWAYFPFEVVVP